VRYHLTIPARINILGNPSDAVEGDFATISGAVNIYAGALIEEAENLVVETAPFESLGINIQLPFGAIDSHEHSNNKPIRQRQVYHQKDAPFPYDGKLDLIKAAINRLHNFSPEFRERFSCKGVHITIWSQVPRQSGLGGSSLFVLLTLAGLRQFYNLNKYSHNDYILAEITQRVEELELGITCGFADRYSPLLGGLAYIDYRGKLDHSPLSQEPFATYERLDSYIADLPLVAITTGLKHDSGDVHGRMRPRYLAEHNEWQKTSGAMPPMVKFMYKIWETAWRGKIALFASDLTKFGEMMTANHRLVNEMMIYCGFSDGAGWANNLFIQSAMDNNALGAKLTGAGGGGSVFALTNPGEETLLAEKWHCTAHNAVLEDAIFYQPQISPQGLKIETI